MCSVIVEAVVLYNMWCTVYISPLHNVIRIIHKYSSMWTYISIVCVYMENENIDIHIYIYVHTYLITIHSMYMTVHYTARYREFVYCLIYIHTHYLRRYIYMKHRLHAISDKQEKAPHKVRRTAIQRTQTLTILLLWSDRTMKKGNCETNFL